MVIQVINVRDTLYQNHTLTCQTERGYVKGQTICDPNSKLCHKPYKFDLEFKGQRRIRIMNVTHHNNATHSYGDRPICQIWYANVKVNRS